MNTTLDRSFSYRNCNFTLAVLGTASGAFLPTAHYESGLPGVAAMTLPLDTDAYAAEAEAWRHAEQQAVRWVHDRTGDGQGQF